MFGGRLLRAEVHEGLVLCDALYGGYGDVEGWILDLEYTPRRGALFRTYTLHNRI